MDPQQSPTTQPNPAPTPAPTAPNAPASPQPTPPLAQPPMPASPTPAPTSTSPVPSPTGKKSKLPLILGIAGGVIVLLLIVGFVFALPALQAASASNRFMHDITTGNAGAAAALTEGGSDNKAFLQDAAKSVSGKYSLKSSTAKNKQYYYLYTLTGATDKYARTIVKKESGGWKVSSFVSSKTTLVLVPSQASSSDLGMDSTSQPPSTSTSSDTGNCLTANDFSFFSNAESSLPDAGTDGTYSAFFQLEFNPNVATYSSDNNPDATTLFNDFKNFYAQDANKKYAIELEASVNSASPDESLANARNSKVQSDLETISGIPASKIGIQPLTNDTTGDSSSDSFFRQVQITLKSADSCAAS